MTDDDRGAARPTATPVVSDPATGPERSTEGGPRPLSLRRSITVVSSLAAVASIVVAVFAVSTYRASVDAQHDQQVHLAPASGLVVDLVTSLFEQESAVRDYVITADPSFLAPYDAGFATEAETFGSLSSVLLPQYPQLHQLIDPVVETTEVWRREVAARQIELVTAGDQAEAIAQLATGRNVVAFDQARLELEALRLAIERERRATRDALKDQIERLFVVALLGALAALSVPAMTWTLARRRLTAPLDRLSVQAEAVASGRLDTPIAAGGSTEIDSLARSVEQMRVQLLGEISSAYSSGMVEAESAERARLAGELHDDPIQVLTSAQWRLEALAGRLEPTDRTAAREVGAALAEVQERLRTLMFRLHPPGLDDEGLAIALDDLLLDTFEGTDVAIHLQVDALGEGATRGGGAGADAGTSAAPGTPGSTSSAPLAASTATLVFRIAAEAIRNVRKHADASRIEVHIRGTGDGVQLSIIDDGAGADSADPNDLPAGPHGISISRALAAAAGGWWHLSARAGHGTTVTCWLPNAAGSPSPTP